MSSRKLRTIGLSVILLILCAGAVFAAAPTVVSVVRLDPPGQSTNAAEVVWRVTFDQPVQGVNPPVPGVTPDDFSVTVVAGAVSNARVVGTAVASSYPPGTGAPQAEWDITVDTGTGDGDIRLDVNEGASIENVDLELLSAGFAEGEIYTIDKTGPTAEILRAADQPDPAVDDKVWFTVTFSEPVTGLMASDIVMSGTARPQRRELYLPDKVTEPAPGAFYSVYAVAISQMEQSGRVTIGVPASAAKDSAGNPSSAATHREPEPGEFYGSDTVTYGIVPKIDRVSPLQTNCEAPHPSRVIFQIDISPAVALVDGTPAGFDTGDITVRVFDAKTGGEIISTLGRYLVELPPFNKSRWNFEIDGLPRSSVVTINIPAGKFVNNDAGSDNYGQYNNASNSAPPNLNWDVMSYGLFGTAMPRILCPATNWVWYDIDPPVVSLNQAQDQSDPTAAPDGVIRFLATFNEPVSGFEAADTALSGTAGASSALATEIENQSATTTMLGDVLPDAGIKDSRTFNIVVSGMTQKGTVIADVPQHKAQDGAGNWNIASTSTDNTVTYDPAPTVTINQAVTQADPTSAANINFTAIFSKPVRYFDGTDVTLSGTANATTAVISSIAPYDGTAYNVAVSGMTNSGTVVAFIPANRVTDANDNLNYASTSTDATVLYDADKPTVTVNQEAEQPDPTQGDTINFTVTFSEPVTGFEWVAGDPARQDVKLSGAAGALTVAITSTGDRTYRAAVSGMTNGGLVIADVPAGAAVDVAGNASAASTSTDNRVNWTPPLTVKINQSTSQDDPTQTSPIQFTAVFNYVVEDFTTGDVTLSGTAGATNSEIVDSGDHKTFSVYVSGMTTSGTVIVSVPAAVAHRKFGPYSLPNRASTSDDSQVTYDAEGLAVTINQASAQVDPTSGSPINFTVVFNQDVTDFATGDVTLKGTAGATTATVTGSGRTYNVAVSGMTASGTVIASLAAGVAHGTVGNSASTSTDNTVTYDITRPTVTVSPAVGQESPTTASPINFTVVFSEGVTGFANADVTLSGTAGATTAAVTEIAPNDGTTYNVAVSGMTQTGTVSAAIGAGVAQDAAGNLNTASETSNEVSYVLALTVTINKAEDQEDPTNDSPIFFKAIFNRPVSDFDDEDVTLSGTAGATTAVVAEMEPYDGTTYSVEVSGMVSPGTVTAAIAANVAHDADGFGNAESTSTENGNTVTYDDTAVEVTVNKADTQPSPTNQSPIHFTAVFSKPVADFDGADVTISGDADASRVVVTGSGTTYDLEVSGMVRSGSVTVFIAAGVAHDAAGNANLDSTSDQDTVIYDRIRPSVTINQADGQTDPTQFSPISFTAIFSEEVTGFDGADVNIGGTAGATVASVTDSGDHRTFYCQVSGMSNQGTVTATIPAGAASDLAGNLCTASSSEDNLVTYNRPVQVTINQASGQADPTSGSPISFTVVFSEAVTGFTTGDVRLSGTAGASVGTVTGGGATYTVAVSGMTQSGTVIAQIDEGVAIGTESGLGNAESTSTDNTVTYDVAQLTVTVNQASDQEDPTSSAPIRFTAVFSKAVTGFDSSDVVLGGTAGANSSTVAGSGDGKTFTVYVSGMTKTGTVTATIPANAASDSVGNGSAASTSTDNQVTFGTPLTVQLDKAVGQADPTDESPIVFTAQFSRPVDDFLRGDVTVSGTATFSARNVVVTNSGDYRNYEIEVSGMSGPGTVAISVAASTAHDADGVGNSASNTATVMFAVSPHTVTINQAEDQSDPTNTGPINFTVVFSSAVTGFSADGVIVTGSAGGAKNVQVTGSGSIYNVAVTGMTTSGTVIADVSANAAYDADGIGNVASTSVDNVVGFDLFKPTVIINQAAGQADPALGTPIKFTVVFSEPVKDFDPAGVDLSGSADPSGVVISEAAPNDGTTYLVQVTSVGGEGTVVASISAGAATDLAGNACYASTSTDNEVTIEIVPGVTIDQKDDQADPTNATEINFTAVFSTPVDDFDGSDVDIAGTAGATTAAVTDSGDHKTFTVVISGMTNPGTVIATIPAGAAHSGSGRPSAASTSTDNVVTFDNIEPTVTIDQAIGQADPTKEDVINFTAVFSEAVEDFATGDVSLRGTAGATNARVTDSGDHKRFAVEVYGMTTAGTVIADIRAGKAHDAAGNGNQASTSTDNTVTFDNVVPTVIVEQAIGQDDPTTELPIKFTVTFSKPVVDFTAASMTLVSSAGEELTCEVTGDGLVYEVSVSGVTYSSIITASVAADVVHDTAGNSNEASTSVDNQVQFDDGQPLTVSVEQAADQADPTNTSPIRFTAVFNKPVVELAAVSVVLSGGAGADTVEIANSGDNKIFTISVSGMDTVGTVSASIPAGECRTSVGEENEASTSVDNTVTFDESAVTVTINQAGDQADPTASTPIRFVVQFNKPVTGFGVGDVVITGTADGTKSVALTGSGDFYTVAVTGITGSGTVIANIPAGAAQDAGGNVSGASTSEDNVVTFDLSTPSVTIEQAADQSDPTSASPINFTVTFSEPVIGFGGDDVLLSGTAGGTKSAEVTGTGTAYNVAVSGMEGTGTVVARIRANAAKDAAGNSSLASTSVDNVVAYDESELRVSINQAADQPDPTNLTPVNFTVVFNKPVVDFDGTDVIIGGTVPGTKTAVVTGSGNTYNVAVEGMDGVGTVTASIGAGGVHDAAGNGNAASTSVDNQVSFDNLEPSVTINQAVGQDDPTTGSPINFTVVFSKDVTGFGTGNVMLSGTAGATLATVTGSGKNYNVAVSGMTKAGTVVAKIAAGVAQDEMGNGNKASTSTDNSVTYEPDTTPVDVTLNQAAGQADPTNGSSISFTAVFSEPVSDFAADAVQITGTAGGTKTVAITGSGTTYNIAVSGMTSTGTVIASIPANAVHDAAGNGNEASTSTDNQVTYDVTGPTIGITFPVSAASCTRNTTALKIAGTASDDSDIVEVTWQDETGHTGTCVGTETFSVDGLTVHAGRETFTLTAKDKAGNTADAVLTVSVVDAAPGDIWNGMMMVSVPIIPDQIDPKPVVGFDGNSWWAFMPTSNSYAGYPDNRSKFNPVESTPGRGFWALFTSAAAPVGTVPDQSRATAVTLKKGWNIVGEPFISPAVWDLNEITVRSGGVTKTLKEAAAAGWVNDYAWGWNPAGGGSYFLVYDSSVIPTAIGQMDPWQGYWMKAAVDCELIFPGVSAGATGERQ